MSSCKTSLLTFCVTLSSVVSVATADPPSHQDFRSRTLAAPSRAIQAFSGSGYYGYESRVFRNNRLPDRYGRGLPLSAFADYFSPSSSSAAAAGSFYYRSSIRGYGSNPYSGLDASRRLYRGNAVLITDPYTDWYSRPYYFDDTGSYGRAQSRRGH